MIIEENIMGRTIKIEVDDEIVDVIKSKFFVNLKYRLFVDKLFFDSFEAPLILRTVHYFDPYGKRKKSEEKKLIVLMREKGIL
jgi:hypothetical protein